MKNRGRHGWIFLLKALVWFRNVSNYYFYLICSVELLSSVLFWVKIKINVLVSARVLYFPEHLLSHEYLREACLVTCPDLAATCLLLLLPLVRSCSLLFPALCYVKLVCGFLLSVPTSRQEERYTLTCTAGVEGNCLPKSKLIKSAFTN